jgi:hypothetical protein
MTLMVEVVRGLAGRQIVETQRASKKVSWDPSDRLILLPSYSRFVFICFLFPFFRFSFRILHISDILSMDKDARVVPGAAVLGQFPG